MRSYFTELRTLFRRIAPYSGRLWRQVCTDLGVTQQTLDDIDLQYHSANKSELVYQGLCRWQEMVGRDASGDKLLGVINALGLKRAEGNATIKLIDACILIFHASSS